MSSRPQVTTLAGAKPITKIHCGECNWEQLVLAQTEEALKCCPWCGWSDPEISKVSEIGGFQEIECEKHGRIAVVVALDSIEVDDFLDNLPCPFCG
jgi:hypothetical protein